MTISARAGKFAGHWTGLNEIAGVYPTGLLGLMSCFFFWWYGRILLELPIFGDAASHATISREFLHGNFLNSESPYPPLYHLLGAGGFAIGGEQGFIALTLASIVALGIAVYFLAKEVTGSSLVGLTSALIAFISPKTAFYGGRLYMEVFLSVLVVVALIYLVRFLKTRQRSDLLLCAIACALAAATKQQGLLLLALPVGAFLFGQDLLRWRQGLKPVSFPSLKLFLPILLAVTLPVLIWQVKSTGSFVPDSTYTEWMNATARQVLQYEDTEAAWQVKWDAYLDESFEGGGYLELGTLAHESRHIWPWDVVTSAKSFFGINSHFWKHQPGGIIFGTLNSLLLANLFVLGVMLFALAKWRSPFTGFLVLFLAVNYVAFLRNNDQLRYHVYVAYALTFLLPFGLYAAGEALRRGYGNYLLGALALSLIVLSTQYLPGATSANLSYWNTQAYAPSAGGIHSIKETAEIIEQRTSATDSVFAIPNNEYAYYLDRDVIWDFRIYFLEEADLRQILSDTGARYLVLPLSATQPDVIWNHVGKAPQSFAEKIKANYALEYRSRAGDIEVYALR